MQQSAATAITDKQEPRSSVAANLSQAIGLKVVKGALVPASDADVERLRRLNLSLNQTVYAELDWHRLPHDLRRIHRLGQLLVEQTDRFAHMNAHQAIKTLQALSGAGCDVVSLKAGMLADLTGGECLGDPEELVAVFQPWTLSPGRMSGAQFAELLDQLCRYVALNVWPECDPEDIASWTELVPRSCP